MLVSAKPRSRNSRRALTCTLSCLARVLGRTASDRFVVTISYYTVQFDLSNRHRRFGPRLAGLQAAREQPLLPWRRGCPASTAGRRASGRTRRRGSWAPPARPASLAERVSGRRRPANVRGNPGFPGAPTAL